MRKTLKICAAFLSLCMLFACDENTEQNTKALQDISANQIYFFYQTSCPHCHYAASYIKNKYPSLKLINLDVRQQSNYNLFMKCAQKFKLPQNTLGTPLICMGDHYIMGWADTDRVKFDSYVQKFK